MKFNRRNVLFGLGTIVAGGGAALGTGAFSSVEAERTVSVETAGDASAFLALEGDGDFVSEAGDDAELELDLGGPTTDKGGDGFNENAVTSVDGVVTITNQGTEDVTVSLASEISDSGADPSGSGSVTLEANGAEVTFTVDGGGTLSPSDTDELNVTVDTRTSEGYNEGDGNLVIVAEATEDTSN